MSCVALNWFKRKKEKKTDAGWTPEQYEIHVKQLYSQIEMLTKERNDCIRELSAYDTATPDPLEEYWNNKRAKSDIKYSARPAFGSLTNQEVDPRIFWVNDPSLPNLWKGNDDDTALACQEYVINKVTYTSDMSQFKDAEVWLFPFETLAIKKGDCEDGAILMANLMINAGIPYWRIRLNAGDVKVAPTAPSGGHAYVTYLREKDNKWYLLDWCFYPDLNFGSLFVDNQKYFGIWFSWNTKYIYADESFERATNAAKQTTARTKQTQRNMRPNRRFIRRTKL
jgi:hypothetical protein